MKKIRDLQRLFERQGLLLEDTDDGSDSWFADTGFGTGGDGGGGDLFKTFVQPFTDVIETGQAAVKSSISSITAGVKIITLSVLQILVPFLKADFKSVLENDKKRQADIREKYKDVFTRNEDALFKSGGSYDGAGVIGVLFPHYMVANNLAKLAGKLTGPIAAETIKAAQSIKETFTDIKFTKESYSRILHKYAYILLEDDKDSVQPTHEQIEEINKLIQDFKDINPAKGKVIRSMLKDGLEAIQITITELGEKADERIQQLKNVKSIEQLEQLVGQKLNLTPKEGESIDPKDAEKMLKDVLPDLIERISTGFGNAVEGYKNNLLKEAKEAGIPENQLELITTTIEEVPEYKKLASLAKK